MSKDYSRVDERNTLARSIVEKFLIILNLIIYQENCFEFAFLPQDIFVGV